MAKKYAKEEIKLLSKNPNVESVRENRLTLTFEFKTKLYEAFERGENIRDVLERNGILHSIIGYEYENGLKKQFKLYGRPKYKRFLSSAVKNSNIGNRESLLKSGYFESHGKLISFSGSFVNEMYAKYPNVDIVEELRRKGINPNDVGYYKIYALQKYLAGEKKIHEKADYDTKVIEILSKHPYVESISSKLFKLKKIFYQRAYLLTDFHINDILTAFEINPEYLSIKTRREIEVKLRKWKPEVSIEDIQTDNIEQLIRIERNLSVLLETEVKKELLQLKRNWLDGDKSRKKALCQWIKDLSLQDTENIFPINKVIKLFGISRSNFYAILDNPNYGVSSLRKEQEDAEDIERIRRVIAYKNHRKGTRMVTMMLPRLEGVTMSRRKVQRLMRKAGLLCEVRKKNPFRRKNKELLKRNLKQNLLKRQFRVHQPMESFLTDVTYLKYEENKTAYLSPVKDSVTGMIVSHEVSETQDLNLTDKMLDEMNKKYGDDVKDSALLHSDQGCLYLSDHYQKKVEKLGIKQSMSRRGNCWDNASMESFFGHFKDEVDYENCSIAELSRLVDEYIEYYNMERPQWNRNKMTPFEYWMYLDQMSDEEYAEYLKKEEKKYKAMMKKSAEKAIQHAKDLGCVIPSNKESDGKKK